MTAARLAAGAARLFAAVGLPALLAGAAGLFAAIGRAALLAGAASLMHITHHDPAPTFPRAGTLYQAISALSPRPSCLEDDGLQVQEA